MFYQVIIKHNLLIFFCTGLAIFIQSLGIPSRINSECEARAIELERAKAIAIRAVDQPDNVIKTVTEISLPEPIRQLLPGIRLISLPYNSDPPSWSRIAVDNCGKAYVIERAGTYPQHWEKNLGNILWHQGLYGTDLTTIARSTVVIVFLTHSQPGLINWTTLEDIKENEGLEEITEKIVIEKLKNGNYRSTINIIGTPNATTQLVYKFDEFGRLIDIQEEYNGPYFE
jgi:hypothetical protein